MWKGNNLQAEESFGNMESGQKTETRIVNY